MIILRNKKVCFLNGFGSYEQGFQQSGYIHDILLSNFPYMQFPVLRSDPEYGLADLKEIQKTKWDLVIGFSMGGAYAIHIDSKKTLLINPGLGISKGIKTKEPKYSKGFKKLEELPILAHDVVAMFSESDNIRQQTEPIYKDLFGEDSKIINFPGKHIPTEDILEKYIVPEIKKLIK